MATVCLAVAGTLLLLGPAHTLDARLYYSMEQARQYLAELGEGGRARYFATECLDLVFIACYSRFLWLVLARLWRRRAWLALLPGLFDAWETLTILWCLNDPSRIERVPWLGVVTAMKWAGFVIYLAAAARTWRYPIKR